MTTQIRVPRWYRGVAIVLLLWEIMGCFACIAQIRYGPAAMGSVDEWSSRYYAALPIWYNAVYVVATFGGLFGGLALLLRRSVAVLFFRASFAAVVVMFGYAFAATDLIAHKGLRQVLPFPIVIAAVAALSIWFATFAGRRGWFRGQAILSKSSR